MSAAFPESLLVENAFNTWYSYVVRSALLVEPLAVAHDCHHSAFVAIMLIVPARGSPQIQKQRQQAEIQAAYALEHGSGDESEDEIARWEREQVWNGNSQ
jgi:hypothetical protein